MSHSCVQCQILPFNWLQWLTFKSSRSQMFLSIGFLKNFTMLIGKHLCWSLETPTQVFCCEICENFKNNFFTETHPVAASEHFFRPRYNLRNPSANFFLCFSSNLLISTDMHLLLILIYWLNSVFTIVFTEMGHTINNKISLSVKLEFISRLIFFIVSSTNSKEINSLFSYKFTWKSGWPSMFIGKFCIVADSFTKLWYTVLASLYWNILSFVILEYFFILSS